MEVVGLALGIASLYKATFDILNCLDAYKSFGLESQASLLHFEAAQIKLADWASRVGIRGGRLAEHHDSRLDDPKRASIIKDALACLGKVFSKVEYTTLRIKPLKRQRSAEPNTWAISDDDDFKNKSNPRQQSSKRIRIAWAAGGRDKLNKDVLLFEGVVNVLYHVVNPSDTSTDHRFGLSISKDAREPISESDIALKTIQESLIALERREIFDWLDALKDDDEYEKHLSSRLEGTCEWILKHPTYIDWESQAMSAAGAKFLWIHGPAGFGKTVLSASLIRHFIDVLKLPVAFCFSSSRAQRTVEFDGIIRTWITQLAHNRVEILNVCQTIYKHGTRRASRSDLWHILREISAQIPHSILALDGLDEYLNVDGGRSHFLAELKHAVASTGVRVIITSRNEVDIGSEVSVSATRSKQYLMLELQVTKEQVNEDVQLYSQSAVAQKFPRQDESFRQDISTQMAENSGGMFLWIKLQQSQLRGSQNRKTVQRIVQEMPQGLYQTYARDWEGIQALGALDRNRAIDILRWLTFGYRALTIDEMAEALIIELDEDSEAFCVDDLPEQTDAEYSNNEIKGLCRSLVEIRLGDGDPNSPKNTIHLVHASVREYLITVLPVPNSFESPPSKFPRSTMHHAMLATYCLRYLDCRQVWAQNNGGSRSFLAYATQLWKRHFRDSQTYNRYLTDIACRFMNSDNPNFTEWRTEFELGASSRWRYPGPLCNPSAMYYASLSGLVPIMDYLHSNKNESLDSVGGLFGTALQLACSQGNDLAFERLIDWGADITFTGGPFNTVINAAVTYGRYGMVQRLLNSDLHLDLMKVHIWEAIMTAARRGHAEIIKLLLECSLATAEQVAHLVDSSRVMSDSLLIAAEHGHVKIVDLLLKHGADIAARDEYKDTALHLAADFNHVEVAKILLQAGASTDCVGALGSPLHSAADHNSLGVAVELIERGASTTVRSKEGASPLYWAALHGFADMVTILLAHGADVDARTNSGHTALWIAIEECQQPVVDILLAHGANVNIATNRGWRPLHLAAQVGLVDIIPNMIAKGADPNALNIKGLSPLHVAVTSGQKAALDVLLQAGADIMPDIDGNTPLMLAVDKLDLDLTTSLLHAGAEINCRNRWGTTLLLTAIMSKLEEQNQQRLRIVDFLLRNRAICCADYSGWAPLHLAAEKGNDAIVALLLDQGHDVNPQTSDGETPLWFAALVGQKDIVRQLLNRGADANLVKYNGVSPLYLALQHRDPDLVRIILTSGCELNIRDRYGDTPLRKAIVWGSNELIENFIQQGADLTAKDNLGMTCLDWLKRLRPDSQILDHGHSEGCVGPDFTVLSRTMCELALRLRHPEKDSDEDVYRLSQGLLMLDMQDDVKVAYQVYFHARGGVFCDACGNDQTSEEPFYTCTACLDTDLCLECMSKHEKQPVLDLCRDHNFLRIVAADAKIRPDQTEAFEQWLLSIVERVRPLGSSEEVDKMKQLTIDETGPSQTEKLGSHQQDQTELARA